MSSRCCLGKNLTNQIIPPMAKDKASFVVYSDLIHTVDHLSDTQTGKLFRLMLQYVNDKNPPSPKDKILRIAFEPIKRQLKRDLKEWEAKRSKRSAAGKLGGIKSGESRRKRSKRSSASKNEANEADNVTVTVTVNDTVNGNVTERDIPLAKNIWEKEEERKRPLNECIGLCLADTGFMSRNKTSEAELNSFSEYLLRTGEEEKTIKDFKKHFSNLKASYPGKLNGAKKLLTADQFIELLNDKK